jgi:hypothetical protein
MAFKVFLRTKFLELNYFTDLSLKTFLFSLTLNTFNIYKDDESLVPKISFFLKSWGNI